MPWIATCPHETVQVLATELGSLGVQIQDTFYRGILFECDLETAYRAHLSLRTASRIQRVVSQIEASTLAQFKRGLNKIVWSEWLRSHRAFTISTHLSDEKAQRLTQEAVISSIVESIKASHFEKHSPPFDPDCDNPITIVAFIRDGSAMLGIDTAGRALHKRGWRINGHPAVLKETLAASILMLAGFNGDEPVMDPLCGSGTIAIEAAYIALNKAPLIHRGKDDFALEHLAGFDRALWRHVSNQLRAKKTPALQAPIYASDIRSEYIDLARKTALRARVEKHINFSVAAFQDVEPPAPRGLLITNLPYGERIGGGQTQKLYREVGETIHKHFSKWRVALLVPAGAPIHLLKLTITREHLLFNGALPVKLLCRGA